MRQNTVSAIPLAKVSKVKLRIYHVSNEEPYNRDVQEFKGII